jgi:gamma-glutamyltranspeptidase / glutathione hydrolase
MGNSLQSLCGAAVIALTLLPYHAFAQAIPPLSPCTLDNRVPACDAVRGDRADGWRAQSRAEVMAPHAMVAASQPLAAQAGLQIMRGGGNAIDAAVTAAAVLNLVEPMMTGVAGDLFAIIYVKKEDKLYVLNASGMAHHLAPVSNVLPRSAIAPILPIGDRDRACLSMAS